ncbi:MAG: phospholipase D-like domain-containing protein [Leptospiraceae bacterium]
MSEPVIKEGKTAWHIASATRLEFLIDAASYYNAFMQSARLAKKSILILGWDLDSRLLLNREADMSEEERTLSHAPEPLPGNSITLLAFLNELLESSPDLRIHILNWDYSVIYALEREAMASIKLFWEASNRLDFQFDNNHPPGASHHQKVVVIDDSIAFAGGIDLTGQRWDTAMHLPQGPGRNRPDGESYNSFHDIQAMVSGEAARCLGELARNRWMRATGNLLQPPTTRDIWPEKVPSTWRDVNVGIIRTDPPFDNRPEVRESEAFLKEAISSARDYIYIENQYLTSTSIAESLCERLSASEGPELVIVTPHECPGWLEEATMGVLRHRIVQRLRESDLYGRLYIYYPSIKGEDIFVHAKTMVVDNRIAFVGSTNLSNRSMGLDTECSIALDSNLARPRSEKSMEGSSKAIGDSRADSIEQGICDYLVRLLSEHLGTDSKSIQKSLQEDSLAGTISRFRGKDRTLIPLKTETDPFLDAVIPQDSIDPEKPLELQKVLADILPLE